MEKNIADININLHGLPTVDGITFIPLHAFNVNPMITNLDPATFYFSQSCIVLKPSKYSTNLSQNPIRLIDANLKLNMNDFNMKLLDKNTCKATSKRA